MLLYGTFGAVLCTFDAYRVAFTLINIALHLITLTLTDYYSVCVLVFCVSQAARRDVKPSLAKKLHVLAALEVSTSVRTCICTCVRVTCSSLLNYFLLMSCLFHRSVSTLYDFYHLICCTLQNAHAQNLNISTYVHCTDTWSYKNNPLSFRWRGIGRGLWTLQHKLRWAAQRQAALSLKLQQLHWKLS